MGPAFFATGCLISLWLAAAISVYAFDFIESAWGHWGSFSVLALFGVGCTFFASISFGIVSAISGRFAANLRAALLGVISAILAIGILAVAGRHVGNGLGLVGGFGVFVLVSGLAPFTVRRQGG